FGRDKVYTNVYLDNKNTDYTEIDVIALSAYGIYVFEMKNYSGYIYGSENDEYWTQVLNKFSKSKFYNPLRQNYAHTKAVERYLELKENETIPVIVFSNHSKLSKINVSNEKNVLQIKDVIQFINKNSKRKEIVFSENELKEFSVKLIERSNMPQEIKGKHIEQVTTIQKNSNFNNIDREK
ncbi:MAG TPA: nuclease-related domain-containing protein, partial [Clostridia bacterium]|nr:nuclease-related domain-containing protein [Clostridia bacterium]